MVESLDNFKVLNFKMVEGWHHWQKYATRKPSWRCQTRAT